MTSKINSLMNVIPDNSVSASPSQKVMSAGLTGGIPVITLKAFGHSLKRVVPAGIIGGIVGYQLPDLVNRLVEYKKQNKPKNIIDELKIMIAPERYSPAIQQIAGMGKQASWIGAMGATNTAVGWIGKKLAKGFVQNPFGKRKLPGNTIPEKIFGLGVKGAVAAGMGYGVKGIADATLQKRPYDYTTMNRNRILAGRIKPEELNSDELSKVKKLGFQ